MAYARRRFSSYRGRKTTKRFARRSRSTVKTPRFKRVYRRPMTKKRILNTTSRKKRDTMLPFTNTNSTGNSQAIAPGVATIRGNDIATFLWCPTARDLTPPTGGSNTIVMEAARTSTTCYMRGLSEKLRMQTSSGIPWLWRRIVFCYRGSQPFSAIVAGDTPTQPYASFVEASNGFTRLWLNQTINAMGNTTAAQRAILFKGRADADWNDLTTAPVDNRRVDLKYDKTVRISSGNASGVLREYKRWHPLNKNLTYDDDENGGVEDTSYLSVTDKRGSGDMYVYDMFFAGTGASATDYMNVTSTSSLYWHEK